MGVWKNKRKEKDNSRRPQAESRSMQPQIIPVENIFSGQNIQVIASRNNDTGLTESIAASLYNNVIYDVYPDIEQIQFSRNTSMVYSNLVGGNR